MSFQVETLGESGGDLHVRMVGTRPAGRDNILKSQLKCKHANEAARRKSFHM